ncbi:MAG: hypothetical protein MUF72_18275 [Elainella sp. Prado103]|nr:hypothetical protein [Elainella sp. Prado103]
MPELVLTELAPAELAPTELTPTELTPTELTPNRIRTEVDRWKLRPEQQSSPYQPSCHSAAG